MSMVRVLRTTLVAGLLAMVATAVISVAPGLHVGVRGLLALMVSSALMGWMLHTREQAKRVAARALGVASSQARRLDISSPEALVRSAEAARKRTA